MYLLLLGVIGSALAIGFLVYKGTNNEPLAWACAMVYYGISYFLWLIREELIEINKKRN
jgi:hypothetical protein